MLRLRVFDSPRLVPNHVTRGGASATRGDATTTRGEQNANGIERHQGEENNMT
jgi:hypothetical protein